MLLNYADRRYEQLAPYATPGDYWVYGAGVRVYYANADYKLFYNDGVSAQVSLLRQVSRSDEFDDVSQTTVKFEWDKLMFEKHALQLVLNAAYVTNNGNAGDTLMFGRVKGFRGIEPNGLWTREIAAASVDYQIPGERQGTGPSRSRHLWITGYTSLSFPGRAAITRHTVLEGIFL